MLVCVIANPLQTQKLGVLSTIETNDTHWKRKRKCRRGLALMDAVLKAGIASSLDLLVEKRFTRETYGDVQLVCEKKNITKY